MANATEDLKTILANGQALIICGAGVSAALTGNKAPGWGQLIKNALEFATPNGAAPAWVRSCRELLAADATTKDWLAAATRIKEELGASFYAFLGQQLKPLVCQDEKFIDALAKMVAAGNVVATTNYDDLLWKGLGTRPVTWRNSETAMNVVTGQSEGVLHLHGHREDVASVIFSGKDYENIRSNEAAQFLQQLSAHQCTLVFVGCSQSGLGDENIGEMLEWFQTHWSGLGKNHFVMHLKGDDSGWPDAVKAISYGENHGDLTGFLQNIAPPRKEAEPRLEVRPNMIGRQEELAEVVGWVLADRHPIIIPGGPGMGKSALALEVAYHADVVARFGKERYFLRLDKAGASDAQSMVNAIALKLGMKPSGGAEQMADIIARSPTVPTLVVLDNLETSWDNNSEAVETVIARLAASEQLNLILTIRGARPNLTCAHNPLKDVEKLGAAEAKELFLRCTGGQFGNDQQLPDLMGVLDGHPLSIILMAAQVDTKHSVAELLKRWKTEAAKMLTKGNGDDRLNNLIISVTLSFEKLSPEGKRLARLVARLPAGLALWMAQEILGDQMAKTASLELAKARLISEKENRLTMLAPLREALMEMPVQLAADEEVLRNTFLNLAAKCESGLPNLSEFEKAEIDNLATVIDWAIFGKDTEQLLKAIWGYSTLHGMTGRGSREPIVRAAKWYEQQELTFETAQLQFCLGTISNLRSEILESKSHIERALKLFSVDGNEDGQAKCLHQLGMLTLNSGPLLKREEFEAALSNFSQAAEIFSKLKNDNGLFLSLLALIELLLQIDDPNATKKAKEIAKDLIGLADNQHSEANLLMSMAEIALKESRFSAVHLHADKAEQLYLNYEDWMSVGNCYQIKGDAAKKENKIEKAREFWLNALKNYEKKFQFRLMGRTHVRLASIETDLKKKHHLVEARRLWLSIGREDLVAQYLEG